MAKDKRRSARGHVSAVAVLLEGQRLLGNHRVLNLSSGGALLVGRAPQGANKQLGVLVRMSTGKVVKTQATIVREESVEDSSVFAIEFAELPPEGIEAINNLVLTAVADEREPTSLVITTAPEVGQLLRRQLATLGHPAFEVSTLADATRLLEAPNQFKVALVDVGLGPTLTGQVLAHLASQKPDLRRIVVKKEAGKARSAAALPGKLAGMAHAVVPRPWTRDDLMRALDVTDPPDGSGDRV